MVVGMSTYVIVFQLNNLVYHTSSTYNPMREMIITRMKNDSREHWASKGKQFATLQPKHETLKPSEWWILLFGAQIIFTSLYRLLFHKYELDSTDTEAPPETLAGSDGTGAFPKEPEIITHATEEPPATFTAFSTSSDSSQSPAPETSA